MLHATLGSLVSAILFSVSLAACGGGGGGGGGSTAQTGTPGSQQNGSTGGGGTQQGGTIDTGDGAQPTTPAHFNRPTGIAIDTNGNLYVADSTNFTIRRIAPNGSVSTLAGSPGASGSSDGSGAAACFSALHGIAVDGGGNVYVVDNSAIRKITSGGAVTTLAGVSGSTGHAEGSGAAARFNQPWGITADAAGNLYVADTQNYVVRRVTAAGVVSTVAGTAGMRGNVDGTSASATFLGPRGVAIDTSGNLYVTDWYGPPAPNIPEGSTFVRRIGTDGVVSTLAGTMGGETGPAQFRDTTAIAVGTDGNVYVAAMRHVQRISSAGTVSAVTGADTPFESLEGLTIDSAGNLYATDAARHVVSRVTQDGEATTVAGVAGEPGSNDTTPD